MAPQSKVEQVAAIHMEAGRQANQAGDYLLAWSEFNACFQETGLPEARISVANMWLKMRKIREAQV